MKFIRNLISKLVSKKDILYDIIEAYSKIPKNDRDNFFLITGTNSVSAWSMDNSRIKDFSFKTIYDNCSL